jgi:hypothetical protein
LIKWKVLFDKEDRPPTKGGLKSGEVRRKEAINVKQTLKSRSK